MVTAAQIAFYLYTEGQCDRFLVDSGPRGTGTGADRGAQIVPFESKPARSVLIEGVQVDTTAGAVEMAWSKRPGAGAGFRGGLLIGSEESIAGAEVSLRADFCGDQLRAFVVCRRPRLAMALAVRRFFPELMTDRPACFHSTEQREQAEAVGAWVMNAAVASGVTFGAHCSIGCSGMGYERRDDGTLVGFPQIGNVVIEGDVDIAAHATVQRGAIGSTRISRGAKIGPHVNVGHNVEIGADVLIAGHAQIGGGAKIGAGAVLWQSCAVANGVTVGEGAVVGMGAQILRDVPAGETWAGNPARPLKKK
jgi:acetyltransferase-like isoleucine patch superfamily enzyme